MEDELVISMSDISKIIKKRLILIILLAICTMCLAYFASIYLIEDVYETQVSMYVAPNPEEANQTTAMNELNYAKAVVILILRY